MMTFRSNEPKPFMESTVCDEPQTIAEQVADIMLAESHPHTAELYGQDLESVRRMADHVYRHIVTKTGGATQKLREVWVNHENFASAVHLIFRTGERTSVIVRARVNQRTTAVPAPPGPFRHLEDNLFKGLDGFPALPAGPSVFDLTPARTTVSVPATSATDGAMSVDDVTARLELIDQQLDALKVSTRDRVGAIRTAIKNLTQEIEDNF